MKLMVKTLKGRCFAINVHPNDTIMAVKKTIEESQGKNSYPCGQQLLIHNGKVLKDESTLEENKVSEDGFLVVMLSKSKTSGTSSASSTAPSTQHSSAAAPACLPVSSNDVLPEAQVQPQTQTLTGTQASIDSAMAETPAVVYDQSASNLVSFRDMDQMVSQIIEMGGGSWDRVTIMRALRAAYNNPERAVEYLYSGIPEVAAIAIPSSHPASNQASGQVANTTSGTSPVDAGPVSGLPNSSPLNLFPRGTTNLGVDGGGGSLDFLRNNLQFQTLRTLVQANPQILQPMLQELGKQNPQLLRLIQEHHAEFLQLINEDADAFQPHEGAEGDLLEQAEADMPHSINVTPEEQEAIERLEAMGFDRAQVIEAFLACDRNEELAVNYLLENASEYED